VDHLSSLPRSRFRDRVRRSGHDPPITLGGGGQA
jgi:hypothetical protein